LIKKLTRMTRSKPDDPIKIRTWTLNRVGPKNYDSNDNNIKKDDNSEEK